MGSPRKILDRLSGTQNYQHTLDTDDTHYDAPGESNPDVFFPKPEAKSLPPSTDVLQPNFKNEKQPAPAIKPKFSGLPDIFSKKSGFDDSNEEAQLIPSSKKSTITEKPAKAAPGKRDYKSY